MTKRRICPECGEPYSAVPALSRKDGKTEICPDCGTNQALDSVRDLLGPEMTDQQWEGYKNGFIKKGKGGKAWTEHFIIPVAAKIKQRMMQFVLHQDRRHR